MQIDEFIDVSLFSKRNHEFIKHRRIGAVSKHSEKNYSIKHESPHET